MTEACLVIKHCQDVHTFSGVKFNIYGEFMSSLSYMIGFMTQLCYNIPSVNLDLSLSIPIERLAGEDKLSDAELAEQKIAKLTEFLEKDILYTRCAANKQIAIALVECLYKPQWDKFVEISYNGVSHPVRLKKPSLPPISVREVGNVLEIVNPYDPNCFVLVDSSRPYKELAYGFNALHYFEHILCTPWTTLNTTTEHHLKDINGFTTPQGICMVYAELANETTLDIYARSMVKFLKSIRKPDYWQRHKPHLAKELNRTISECMSEPSLTSFSRNPASALRGYCHDKAFAYWSAQPMRLVVAHPAKSKLVEWMVDQMSTFDTYQPPRPTIDKFDYLPYEVIANQAKVFATTEKVKPDDIVKEIAHKLNYGEPFDALYGIDVKKKYMYRVGKYAKNMYDDEYPFQLCTLLTTFRPESKELRTEFIAYAILNAPTYGALTMLY